MTKQAESSLGECVIFVVKISRYNTVGKSKTFDYTTLYYEKKKKTYDFRVIDQTLSGCTCVSDYLKIGVTKHLLFKKFNEPQ